jgi:hypothetical protein
MRRPFVCFDGDGAIPARQKVAAQARQPDSETADRGIRPAV